ncbi:hypothetical protein [Sphingorhabdus sp.]|uniref:hypothetical protein n=1 Tax=Sphingorhabdus sp. TaxID=1902408 RepID=UPI0037C6EBFB
MMVGREDLVHFNGMMRSWRSATHVARLFARYGRDRLSHPRGTRPSKGFGPRVRLDRGRNGGGRLGE